MKKNYFKSYNPNHIQGTKWLKKGLQSGDESYTVFEGESDIFLNKNSSQINLCF